MGLTAAAAYTELDVMADGTADNLRLTDFMDLATLQEIQDSFAAVADVKATITDASGKVLTQPTPTASFIKRQRALADAPPAMVVRDGRLVREGAEYVAPIIVNDERLGTIRMSANGSAMAGVDEAKLATLAAKFGLEPKQVRSLVTQWVRSKNTKPAAVQFLYLLANAIARLCYQEFQLRQRIEELTAVNSVAMILAEPRDLQKVLQRTVKTVCEVMQTKAASIRLIDAEHDELVIKAVYNLSPEYLAKGPVRLSRQGIDNSALGPEGFDYVRDMATDPRVQYPQEAQREGIASMLSVGMRYKGNPVGVLRVYTDEETVFTPLRIDLLKAIATQAAAAIENARLLEESLAAEALERQVQLAADVQRRMIPAAPPTVPGLDMASVYVPCYTLGGDFFDFITLPYDNVGLAVADVSGKGVPASLIMASVRASLRAAVDNVYYLYEVMGRINQMLCRDTQPNEFCTLFYGVLDAPNKRFTYCNAGHPPGLLLRDGQVVELHSENLVLGIDPTEQYQQSVLELKQGDTLLLYSDGLLDGMNFAKETFGRHRLTEVFKRGGETAEAVAQGILWELRKFEGISKRTDDVTMIVVKVR
jgi:sigma-B regulation protein RsbU (phosphoserine phosphatase)